MCEPTAKQPLTGPAPAGWSLPAVGDGRKRLTGV
jgi:hypothetical protein